MYRQEVAALTINSRNQFYLTMFLKDDFTVKCHEFTMLNRDNNMFNLRTRDCLSPAVGRGWGWGERCWGITWFLGGTEGDYSSPTNRLLKGGTMEI